MFLPLRRGLRARRGRRRSPQFAGAIEALESRILLSATGGEAWLFDFGTSSSPVEAGYTKVTPLDSYTSAAGYGWLSSPVSAASRSGGTPLTRDLNFSPDMTFGVDLANGTYDVTLTIGDLFSFHDQMGVFFEGAQYDEISTAGGQVLTRTYTVQVADGQLTLRLQDLGGSDANAVINGLEIRLAPPDLTGPRIIAAQPLADGFGYVSGARIAFDEPIPSGGLTPELLSLAGPDGSVAVAQVNQIDLTTFELWFAEQRAPGDYTLTVAPGVQDLAGNLLDQDGDGTGGEALDDQFTLSFTIAPLTERFDFGTATSPVEPGFRGVSADTMYSADANFGWLSGSVSAALRTSGTALERDLNFTTNATFGIDVTNAVYEVTVHMGDTGNFAHDQMGVFLEGVQADTVSSSPGQIAVRTYRVSVSDGQLTLRLADLGGADANAVINGLEVRFLGYDITGPRVVSVHPGDVVIGSFDRVTLTFDEPIHAGTFTLDDVSFTGPDGVIAATAVNRLSDAQYEVVFERQFAAGQYTLNVGPAIEDLAGNLMDQDQDGVGGEGLEDQFTATFVLEPFLMAFDFGTATSTVADGFIGVTPATVYSAETGHGWVSGTVLGVDRTTGTDLTRDLNFTQLATFAADVPIGTYGVTLTLGDTGAFGHDQMGIFLEGVQVDSVSTSPRQVVTRTYTVDVSDGQFTLLLDDLGGTDRNVVINGLELALLTGEPVEPPTGDPIAPSDQLPANSRAASVARVPDNVPSWTPAAAKFNGGSSSSGSPGGGRGNGRGNARLSGAADTSIVLTDATSTSSSSTSQIDSTAPGGVQAGPGNRDAAGTARGNSGSQTTSPTGRGRGAAVRAANTVATDLAALDDAFATPELFDLLLSRAA